MSGRLVRQVIRDFCPSRMGLTILVVVWWLLLGGSIIWIMPGHIVTAAPTSSAISAGTTVRVTQSGSRAVSAARDRASFTAMRVAAAARYEEGASDGVPAIESIEIDDGQIARVLMVDGDAVMIELLDGGHSGELAWIRSGALRPTR